MPKTEKIPMRGFAQSLPMALLRAREAVMQHFRPGLRERGMTEQQWRILRALAHGGPMEVTALAQATFLLPPSLSRILPDLEARKLLVRRQDTKDARRGLIFLAPVGQRLIVAHAPTSEDTYDDIEQRFGRDRLDLLLTLLRELESTMSDATVPGSGDSASLRPKRSARDG